MKRLLRLLLLLGALPSAATEVRVDGSYRVRLAGETNYLLDGSGTRLGQERFLEHRLRLSPKIVSAPPAIWRPRSRTSVIRGDPIATAPTPAGSTSATCS